MHQHLMPKAELFGLSNRWQISRRLRTKVQRNRKLFSNNVFGTSLLPHKGLGRKFFSPVLAIQYIKNQC